MADLLETVGTSVFGTLLAAAILSLFMMAISLARLQEVVAGLKGVVQGLPEFTAHFVRIEELERRTVHLERLAMERAPWQAEIESNRARIDRLEKA